MRVLLAGASGAIGRYLVPQLIEAKHEVIGITRTPGSLAGTGAREVVADVLDRPALLAALEGIRADAVIHQLTALSKAPARSRGMRETNRLRTEGTSALIAAARKVGAKKLVAASFFGGYGLLDHGRSPLPESTAFGELDGRTDAVQTALLSLEQQVRAFGGVSLRFGLFYDSTTSSVSPVSATWDGVLPMLHLSDAAAATVRALTKYKAGAVYNIADDRPMSYRDRETARAKAAGLRTPARLPDALLRLVAPYGALLLTRTSMSLDTTKAHGELDWTPEFPSLRECLGVAGVTPKAVIIPKAAPTPEPVPEVLEVPEPDPVPEALEVPQPDPVPEVLEVPEPAVVVEEQKPAPSPKPVTRTGTPSTPRTPKGSKAPVAPTNSGDAFDDMDAAIARIGLPHDE
jgi:nucleoside-diphosphate-sugar epimerase